MPIKHIHGSIFQKDVPNDSEKLMMQIIDCMNAHQRSQDKKKAAYSELDTQEVAKILVSMNTEVTIGNVLSCHSSAENEVAEGDRAVRDRSEEKDLVDYRAEGERAKVDDIKEDFIVEGRVEEKIAKEQDVKEMKAEDVDEAVNVRINEEVVEETNVDDVVVKEKRAEEDERVKFDVVEEIVKEVDDDYCVSSNDPDHPLSDNITGLLFALNCQMPCVTHNIFSSVEKKRCSHGWTDIDLKHTGQYVNFPSFFFHCGYFQKDSNKVVVTAQLFASPNG